MIPPSTTITEEGRRARRVLLWVGVLIVGLNMVVWAMTRLSSGGGVTGPVGSSYVTTRSGAAALEGTLRRLGHATHRLRVPLNEVPLDPDGTVMIIDVGASDYASAELNALDEYLREGGRVMVAGQAALVERLIEDAPTWRAAGRDGGRVVGDLVGPARGGTVGLAGFGSLDIGPEDIPFLVADDDIVVGAARRVGEGTFLWLADSFPLHNEGLGQGDTAVAVVGMIDPFGTVTFDELRHGYSEGGGVWSVIPPRWRMALILGGAAAVAALVGYGRRFGPPYDRHRRLPPGRETYLEGVAGIMARSGDRAEALSTIRVEARRRLEEWAEGQDLRDAALGAGLDTFQTEAVLGDDDSDETLVAADRALATLIREKR